MKTSVLVLLVLAVVLIAVTIIKRGGKATPPKADSGEPEWAAIDRAFQRIYPEQTNPKHFANPVPKQLGGPSYLAGFAVYEAADFYHVVTLGLTDAFGKSGGNGMEFSIKLRKSAIRPGDEEAELKCACGILDSIATMTFENGEVFRPGEDIYTGQTTGIDIRKTSKLTGFVLVRDTTVPFADTPHGRVDIVEFVGCTDAELRAVREDRISVDDLVRKIGSDLTDYKRDSVL